MTELLQPHMAPPDLFAWNMEEDPLLRSTIVAVATLDRRPDWDRLVAMIDRGTRVEPSFRCRAVVPPLRLGPPRWVVDPDFDLSWHLRRTRLPSPGSLEQLLDLARTAGMQAFDRDRPLWQFTLVEGLEGDRAALVMKIHHSLTDGIGGMQIANEIVDFERAGTPRPDPPAAPEPGPVDALSALFDAVGFQVGQMRDLVGTAAGAVVPTACRAVRDPLGLARQALGTAVSAARFVRPITRTMSPVMTERHLGWRYGVLEVPFGDLHRAAGSAAATLNDAFLAGVLIGLRSYHERHGAAVTELRVTMPVSLRADDDPAGGNKVTLVRFPLPLDVFEPAGLMAAVDERVRAWRHEPAVELSRWIAAVLNLLPSPVIGGMLKHVDFLASNVPGSPVPLFVAGARVERYYAFGPTIGAAVNVTLMSYDRTCCVGVNVDTGAVPDLDVLLECLREGFAEVVATA